MRAFACKGLLGCTVVFIWLLLVLAAAAQEKRYTVPFGDSPVLGPSDAPVTIIEFIDYQ